MASDLIPTAGLAAITGLLADSDYKYVAWGTGTTGAAAGDTGLETESAEDRTSGTQSQQTTTVANDTYRVVGTITATDTRAITEAGILSAADAGTLLRRCTFDAMNLVTGDSIAFTFNTKFANA
jgi:hypothetical protein